MSIAPSNTPTPTYPPAGEQRGFTLIEVLVAVLVLAIGLLGMAHLQALSVQFNHGALLRTQATHLSYQITDAMRANVAAANARDYDIDFGETPSGPGDAVADDDLDQWTGRLATALPAGEGAINVQNGIATVSVRWDSSKDPDSAAPAIDPDDPDAEVEPVFTEFTLRTRL